jgi:hypothetical protein
VIRGRASFAEDGSVLVDGVKYKGKHTLIAVGGHPHIPKEIPGAELGTDSDGFFELKSLPKWETAFIYLFLIVFVLGNQLLSAPVTLQLSWVSIYSITDML